MRKGKQESIPSSPFISSFASFAWAIGLGKFFGTYYSFIGVSAHSEASTGVIYCMTSQYSSIIIMINQACNLVFGSENSLLKSFRPPYVHIYYLHFGYCTFDSCGFES